MIHLANDSQESDTHFQHVALKFMKEADQFLRELEVRDQGNFSPLYVVGILRHYSSTSDKAFEKELKRKNFDRYRYCFVMPAAGQNLNEILNHGQIAGKNWEQIRSISLSIAQCINHMHSCGYIHGTLHLLRSLPHRHTSFAS